MARGVATAVAEPEKLGQSVSHGCVRLGDEDIAKLYQMANVGDTVIIY